jgi:hypothetical protein
VEPAQAEHLLVFPAERGELLGRGRHTLTMPQRGRADLLR